MSNPIRSILVLFKSADNHYAFRYIRCRDGKMVEARSNCGESTIATALHSNYYKDGQFDSHRNDYFYTIRELKVREFNREVALFAVIGSSIQEIRSFVEKEMGDGSLI